MRYILLGRSEREAREWLREKFGYDAQYLDVTYVGSPRACEGLRVRSWEILRAPGWRGHREAKKIDMVLERSVIKTETPEDKAIARYLRDRDPIAQHHRPDMDMRYCEGCDMGCSCEAADWPCSTAKMIAERDGYELPERVRGAW